MTSERKIVLVGGPMDGTVMWLPEARPPGYRDNSGVQWSPIVERYVRTGRVTKEGGGASKSLPIRLRRGEADGQGGGSARAVAHGVDVAGGVAVVAETVNIRVRPAEELVAYMVAWTYRGRRELIDCDSAQLAGTIAAMLAESGRTEVTVMEVAYEPDPEMARRAWKRITERIAAEGVEMAVFG